MNSDFASRQSATEMNQELKKLACFNFYRGWRAITEFYKAYLPSGVSAQQSYILEICNPTLGTQVGEIASILEIEISAISNIIKRMESNELIERRVNAENRRQVHIYLTETGCRLRNEIRDAMVQADAELSKVLSPGRISKLAKLVDEISAIKA